MKFCFWSRWRRIITSGPKPFAQHIVVNNPLLISSYHSFQKSIIFFMFHEHITEVYLCRQMNFCEFMRNSTVELVYASEFDVNTFLTDLLCLYNLSWCIIWLGWINVFTSSSKIWVGLPYRETTFKSKSSACNFLYQFWCWLSCGSLSP